MRTFSAGQITETLVIALDTGEDVLESVQEAIKIHDIKDDIVVSGIDSLSKVSYHIVDPGDEKPWKDTYFTKEGTIELMAIQGMIANGEPHLHITVSQDDK